MNTDTLHSRVAALQRVTDEFSRALPLSRLRDAISTVIRARVPGIDWPALRIGDLEVTIPIVQGGMGVGISLSRLASAVAERGGIGVIAANAIGLIEKDYYRDGRAANIRALRREIRTARRKTNGVIGVNIMVAVNDFHELLDVAIEERVDLVFMGAGLPIKGLPVERIREAGIKVVPIVSSRRATEMIFRMWKKIYDDVPDAVVVEGPLAGGHLGFSVEQIEDPAFRLEAIVPDVVEAVRLFEEEMGRSIPVIAGGGIYTGEDIAAILDAGASGVQMGTRFVATTECDADEKFKQAYVECGKSDIGLLDSPVGMPGRAIRNDFIRSAEAGQRPAFRCAWQCLASCKADAARYCISIALNNARLGKIDKGFVFAGANAYRVDKIVSVDHLMETLGGEYREAATDAVVRRLGDRLNVVEGLRRRFSDARSLAAKLEQEYGDAITTRIRHAGDAGIDRIRDLYDSALSSVRALQLQIAETLADAWSLLSPEVSATAEN